MQETLPASQKYKHQMREKNSFSQAVGFFLYNTAYGIFTAGYLPIFLQKIKQEPEPRKLLRERFGFFSEDAHRFYSDKRVIWLHAVSVGEVLAVKKLALALLEKLPNHHLVITTVTPTGQKLAREISHPRISTLYFPLDWQGCCRRFLEMLNPELLLLAETEIWPGLLKETEKKGVPAGILNARLSEKSAARYGWAGFFTRPLFEFLDFVLAQTIEDAERFERLGVPQNRIAVLGNLKFDNVVLKTIDPANGEYLRIKWGIAPVSRVWVCGSTHPKEETVLFETFDKIRKKFPDLKMVLAPRHIERASDIFEKIRGRGFQPVLSTAWKPGVSYDVLILDQLGILKDLYEIADVVFVGGSLMRRGGQNPIEPASFRKAILHGPYTFNFEKIYRDMDQAGAALRVTDGSQLYSALERLLNHEKEREALGENAFQWIRGLQGAALRHEEWILSALQKKVP